MMAKQDIQYPILCYNNLRQFEFSIAKNRNEVLVYMEVCGTLDLIHQITVTSFQPSRARGHKPRINSQQVKIVYKKSMLMQIGK